MQPAAYSKTSNLNLDITRFFDSIIRCFKNISFGRDGATDNIAGAMVTPGIPFIPDTEFPVEHNLGIVPIGYIVVYMDFPTIIYDSTITPWDTTNIYLKASSNANIIIFVLG